MKKQKLLALLLCTSVAGFAQTTPVLQVDYDLTDITEYYTGDSVSPYLGTYEKVLFMPSVHEEHHDEVIFNDGTYKDIVDLHYPYGPVEDGQLVPTKMIVSDTGTVIYVDSVLYGSVAFQPDTLVGSLEFTQNYMVSDPFPLPLDSLNTADILNDGFIISKNDSFELEFSDDSSYHYYNLTSKYEEHSVLEEGKEIMLEGNSYTEGDQGQWFFDTRIVKTIEDRDSFCLTRARIQIYSNFHRIFLGPHAQNVSTQNTPQKELHKWWVVESNYQDGVQIMIRESNVNLSGCKILDMRGRVITEGLKVTSGVTTFDASRFENGIYILVDPSGTFPSTKFILTNR